MTKASKSVYRPTAASLFSGIGGFCLALREAGAEVVWANESDDRAAMTFRQNFPEVKLYKESIKDLFVTGSSLEPVDLLTAGFPCQSFSQAGSRKGFSDERGELFLEIARLVREFGEDRPALILMENVPFLQYGQDGAWMDKVIREIQRVGYWFKQSNCRVLNTAKTTSIPQGRERLYMVAASTAVFDSNPFEFPLQNRKPHPLNEFVDKSKRGPDDTYLPKENRYYKLLDETANGCTDDTILQWRKYYPRTYVGICPTLTANMGAGGHNVPFVKDEWGIRKLTVDECMLLQGFDPSEFHFPDSIPQSRKYYQLGNTISVSVGRLMADRCIAHILKTKS